MKYLLWLFFLIIVASYQLEKKFEVFNLKKEFNSEKLGLKFKNSLQDLRDLKKNISISKFSKQDKNIFEAAKDILSKYKEFNDYKKTIKLENTRDVKEITQEITRSRDYTRGR